jgi:hypothetical protein
VPNSSTTARTRLDIRTCTGGANQQWAFLSTGSYASSSDASYVLVNLNSGQVMDVSVLAKPLRLGDHTTSRRASGGQFLEDAIGDEVISV